jgi:hypothetical protein
MRDRKSGVGQACRAGARGRLWVDSGEECAVACAFPLAVPVALPCVVSFRYPGLLFSYHRPTSHRPHRG